MQLKSQTAAYGAADFALTGKVALVTGASGLLGQEHCAALAAAGAQVAAIDICDDEKVADLENCTTFQADITSENSVQALATKLHDRYGQVDVLVNNAAINEKVEALTPGKPAGDFETFSMEVFRQVMDVNVTGTLLMCQVFGSQMAQRGSGSIINIGSTYGLVAPNQDLYTDESGRQLFYKSPAYPASKSAVLALTRYLAAYWGKDGVRVNALSPGGVQAGQDKHFIQSYSKRTPLGRMAEPHDYRGALVFLASDSAPYMTGANLVVDGGFTIW